VAGAGCCSRAGWGGVHSAGPERDDAASDCGCKVRDSRTRAPHSAGSPVIECSSQLACCPVLTPRVSAAVPTASSLSSTCPSARWASLCVACRRPSSASQMHKDSAYVRSPPVVRFPPTLLRRLHTIQSLAHACLRWHRSSAPEPALHGLACAHVLSAQSSQAACIKSKFRLATFAEVSGKCPFALKPHPAAALHHAAPLPRGRPCFSSRVAFRPLRGTPNRCIVRFYCRFGACTHRARTACRMPCVHAWAWEWQACGRQRANKMP